MSATGIPKRLAALAGLVVVLAGAVVAMASAQPSERRVPTAGMIAFHGAHGFRGLGIYVMRADGTGVRRLTRGQDDDLATWSPDGRRIAFVRQTISTGKARADIFVVNVDGRGLRRLIPDAEFVAWSPDGRLAFTRVEAGVFGTYVANAAGGAERRILTTSDFGGLAWAPDGRRIAYVVGESLDLWVMNADGSGTQKIAANAVAPAWSPDGRRIAVARFLGGGVGETWVIAVRGGVARRVTRNAEHPSWSPDGKKLVVDGIKELAGGIGPGFAYDALFVVNADGTKRTQLYPTGSRPPITASNPTWHR